MTELGQCTVAGAVVERARIHVPPAGAWVADLEFLEAPDVAGRVTIQVGSRQLVGTVAPRFGGTHVLQRRVRVVAGGGGWGGVLPARAYHSDGGVAARTVVEDLVRESGEQLDGFAPESARLVGDDFVRPIGPASRALEDAIGAVPWWVDYDGKTQVGMRATSPADATRYEVLDFEATTRVAEIAVDELDAVVVGSVLSERLDEPQTVRELELEISAEGLRIRAWCGGAAGSLGRGLDALAAIARAEVERRLFGLWQYRVIQRSGDRLELQAVRAADGLPNVLPISIWPGVAGAFAEIAAGAEVLVQFVGGLRSFPIVTHACPKGAGGFVPFTLKLTADSSITVEAASEVVLDAAAMKLGALAVEPPAWASKVLEELVKIQVALNNATSSPSGGALLWTIPGTQYVPPTTASEIAAQKTTCE